MGGKDSLFNALIWASRAALVAALVFAGWRMYARLPAGEEPPFFATTGAAARETEVRVVLRRSANDRVLTEPVPLEFYAHQEEAQAARLPGVNKQPAPRSARRGAEQFVRSQLDERGEAVVALRPGRWLLRASLPAGAREEVTWRLPISVAGRSLTVELTSENAYTREKKF